MKSNKIINTENCNSQFYLNTVEKEKNEYRKKYIILKRSYNKSNPEVLIKKDLDIKNLLEKKANIYKQIRLNKNETISEDTKIVCLSKSPKPGTSGLNNNTLSRNNKISNPYGTTVVKNSMLTLDYDYNVPTKTTRDFVELFKLLKHNNLSKPKPIRFSNPVLQKELDY
jgi:hypothetical protein